MEPASNYLDGSLSASGALYSADQIGAKGYYWYLINLLLSKIVSDCCIWHLRSLPPTKTVLFPLLIIEFRVLYAASSFSLVISSY